MRLNGLKGAKLGAGKRAQQVKALALKQKEDRLKFCCNQKSEQIKTRYSIGVTDESVYSTIVLSSLCASEQFNIGQT